MNSLIIILIILLSALIINTFFNNYFNTIEGHSSRETIIKECPKCDSNKAKELSNKNNGVYKTLEGKYKDLSLQLNLVKDKQGELDNQLKSNNMGTENSVKRTEEEAKAIDKEREAGLKGIN